MNNLFSIAYLPPVSYFVKCISSDGIIIDQHEHFIKQTYRNRCNIYGPNGRQTLVIPVVHDNLFRLPIKEVKISYDAHWNKIHWKSITSAYRNSPFFEFYEDDFRAIFENPPQYLFEFNLTLMKLILKLFKGKKEIQLSVQYEKTPDKTNDLRNSFHPKNTLTEIVTYHQVFSERHGFLNDLSVIDLLFNEGGSWKENSL